MNDPDERLVGADRVLALLIELAQHPEGASLDDLAAKIAASKSTVHRALGSLVRSGLADQAGRGRYVLGDEFVRLAFRHHSARPETSRVEPALRNLTALLGETTHYAVLDGHDVVYRAKVDPEVGAVRLTSQVGGRNPAALTAVGKVLLSHTLATRGEVERGDVERWLDGAALPVRTPTSITSIDAFVEELRLTRARGYGVDDQENEAGVNCLAAPVYLDGGDIPSGAVSVSGLAFRCPLSRLVEARDEIRDILASALGGEALGKTAFGETALAVDARGKDALGR